MDGDERVHGLRIKNIRKFSTVAEISSVDDADRGLNYR